MGEKIRALMGFAIYMKLYNYINFRFLQQEWPDHNPLTAVVE